MAPCGAAAEITISGIRIGAHQEITRLILSVSGPMRYRVREEGPPYRIVLEFPGVGWSMAQDLRLTQSGPVRRIRFRTPAGKPQQVVVNLSRPMRVQKSFSLRPNQYTRSWRVVVDLEPLSEDAFERLMRRRGKRLAAKRGKVAAKPSPRPKRKPARKPDRKPAPPPRPLIVIDPGHGGRDTGAINRFGVREKDIVLRFARRLRTALVTTGRYRVAFTRVDDTYLTHKERFGMAEQLRADLFISIHADSNPVLAAEGMTVYTVAAKPSDKSSAERAKRENSSGGKPGTAPAARRDPLAGIRRDSREWRTLQRSRRFGRILVGQMKGVTPLAPRPLRFAPFAVLRAKRTPSVLLELGFITNKTDRQRLVDDPHMRRVARTLVRALDRYFSRRRGRPSAVRN